MPAAASRTGAQREVSLIIPAYNEAASIGQTVDEALAYFRARGMDREVIVAPDGEDGTREVVLAKAGAEPALKGLENADTRGKGYNIRRAVSVAEGSIIGFTDADNKTPIDEFDKFLPLLEEGYDLAIGSRAIEGRVIERKQPWFRQLGSFGFALFMHTAVGLRHIPDTQCGFKFFTRATALDLFGRQRIDGYMFDIEILCLATQAGYRLAQVPVRWRDDGDSRYKLVSG